MQIHLDADDPLAIRARDRFFPGQPILRVPIMAHQKSGQCYANVVDHVRKHGGSIQLGWLITHVPKLFVEATHHAVWRDPEGRLSDITDFAFAGMDNTESTFIEDHATPPPVDYWHPSLPSWFLLLDDSTSTKQYARAAREWSAAMAKCLASAQEAGLSVRRLPDGQIGIHGHVDPSSRVAELIRAVGPLNEAKLRLRAQLRAR